MSGMQQQQQPPQLVQEKPFGSWKSPISSQLTTASSVGLQELHVDRAEGQQDVVYWIEQRSSEGGRCVVCSSKPNQAEPKEHTPAEFNVRTKVHEYGGGAAFVHDGKVYFSNFKDQRMYVADGTGSVQAITPAETEWRYADGMFSNKLGLIYCIREDHSKVKSGERKEPENTVVVINPATQQQQVLVSGCDFYASPKVSPDGKRIVWMQWNHPNMPWDSSEIWAADLIGSGEGLVEGSAGKVSGGVEAGEDISVSHPVWTPNNQLLYASDITDWWNLYHVSPAGEHVNLCPKESEAVGPHSQFANYSYDCDPTGSGKIATRFGGKLGILDMKLGQYREINTGYASHKFVQYASTGHIYCIAGSPTKLSAVIRVDPSSDKVEIVQAAGTLAVDAGYLSTPTEICWPTRDGKTSYGFYYPPQNKDFRAPEGTAPPLLVKVHGGPTACCSCDLDLGRQYWTSRGFAMLDVNYRGSTGYGRKYRHSLRKNWGVTDIDDCSSGALYLAKKKKVPTATLR